MKNDNQCLIRIVPTEFDNYLNKETYKKPISESTVAYYTTGKLRDSKEQLKFSAHFRTP